MTVCVLYCNEPPEDVDSCTAKSPNTIVVAEGMSKVVCGKIFFSSCNDVSSNLGIYLPVANITVANTISVSYSGISYSVDYYGKNMGSGTVDVSVDGLFKITLPPLRDTKYCYLSITHPNGRCVFPIVVCS